MTRQAQSSIEQAWALWRRRKWLVVAIFLGPFTAATAMTRFLPDIYQSTATVIVERQQVPEKFVQPTVTGALDTRLQTISQEILSRSRLEELITRFDLYREMRIRLPGEAVIARMRRDIQVKLQSVQQRARGGATVAFTVGYQGRDPRVVAAVTNTLASFYVEENLRIRERLASGTAQFLKGQLEETRRRLEEQEARVSEFKRRHLGELPEQLAANLATLERLNAQLRLNRENQARTQERRDALVHHLTATGPNGYVAAPADGADAVELRLVRMRRELEALRVRYTDKYPEVVRVKAEIAALENQLAGMQRETPAKTGGESAAPASRLKQAPGEIEAELRLLKNEERSLRATIGQYQQRVENVPRREQEFQELARDYQSTKDLYGRLLQRYEEAQLAETLEQRQQGEQFRVVEPANPSEQPAAPNRFRLTILGFVASVGLAVAAALLAEQFDQSFRSIEELRVATGAPVLARIPEIVTPADTRRRRRRLWIRLSLGVVGLAALVGIAYFLSRGSERLVSILLGSF